MKLFIRITIAFTVLTSIVLGASLVRAQTQNRAGLVVYFEDSNRETRCVNFTETSISGYELLQRSGLSIIASFEAQGAAICKIEELGCPSNDCFCQSPPDYWSYWQLEDGEWVYAAKGSSNTQIQDGDVDAWVWGPGDPPPYIDFDQICAATAANPTATATQTKTQQTGSSLTATPTATNLPPTANQPANNQASPVPQSQSNLGPRSGQAYPPPAPGELAVIPTVPTSNLPLPSATPINPHLLFAARLITPTPRSSAPTLQSTPDDPIINNESIAITDVQEGDNPISPGSYLFFGILALALVSIAIVQSVNKNNE